MPARIGPRPDPGGRGCPPAAPAIGPTPPAPSRRSALGVLGDAGDDDVDALVEEGDQVLDLRDLRQRGGIAPRWVLQPFPVSVDRPLHGFAPVRAGRVVAVSFSPSER